MKNYKPVKLEDRNAVIIKIIGSGKANKGIEKLVKNYKCTDPKIKKIIQDLYGRK